jgi:hypothetical protein
MMCSRSNYSAPIVKTTSSGAPSRRTRGIHHGVHCFLRLKNLLSPAAISIHLHNFLHPRPASRCTCLLIHTQQPPHPHAADAEEDELRDAQGRRDHELFHPRVAEVRHDAQRRRNEAFERCVEERAVLAGGPPHGRSGCGRSCYERASIGGRCGCGRAPGGCRTGERATRRMGRLRGYTEEREYGDTGCPCTLRVLHEI